MSRWLWTSRAGFEGDLAEELPEGRVLGAALAIGAALPPQAPPPIFGRQGFPIAAEAQAGAGAIARELAKLVPANERPFALQLWVPDSEAGNRLAAHATQIGDACRTALLASLGVPGVERRLRPAHELTDPVDPILQVCVAGAAEAYVGALERGQAVSTWPGGRARMRVPAGAPSRAAAKLAEAFAWLGFGPEPDDVCVDLGAAPGGWTWLLLKRRARVIAVDRAHLDPRIAADKRVRHIRRNAFDYVAEEAVDWLFCDLVHKPAEVAKLLAKWGKFGRRARARCLVANIKLPMKRRVIAVAQVRQLLASGGWRDIRMRQLYHDRDEITLHARRA